MKKVDQLNALAVKALRKPGRHHDGKGLYLKIKPGHGKGKAAFPSPEYFEADTLPTLGLASLVNHSATPKNAGPNTLEAGKHESTCLQTIWRTRSGRVC